MKNPGSVLRKTSAGSEKIIIGCRQMSCLYPVRKLTLKATVKEIKSEQGVILAAEKKR